MTEQWEWKRFFNFEPNRFGKDLMIGVRLCLIIFILCLTCVGAKWLFDVFSPKDAPPTPDIVTAETANIDKSHKTVTQTYMPLSNIFSFGSHGKTQSKEDK